MRTRSCLDKTKRWFAAVLLFESMHPKEQRMRKLFELQVRLVRASSEQSAWDQVNEIGKDQQHSFANVYDNKVEWVLREVVDVVELLDNATADSQGSPGARPKTPLRPSKSLAALQAQSVDRSSADCDLSCGLACRPNYKPPGRGSQIAGLAEAVARGLRRDDEANLTLRVGNVSGQRVRP